VQEVIELPVSKIKPAAGMVHTIPITDVVFSQKHYTRTESQSPAKVQEYAKSIADGEFPPILLSCSDDPALCDILLDGWHRWMARKERHLETIDVEYIDIDGMDIHEIRRKAARSNFRPTASPRPKRSWRNSSGTSTAPKWRAWIRLAARR
jgi:ParB-like nuclease domain